MRFRLEDPEWGTGILGVAGFHDGMVVEAEPPEGETGGAGYVLSDFLWPDGVPIYVFDGGIFVGTRTDDPLTPKEQIDKRYWR